MNDRVRIEIDALGVAEVRLVRGDKISGLDFVAPGAQRRCSAVAAWPAVESRCPVARLNACPVVEIHPVSRVRMDRWPVGNCFRQGCFVACHGAARALDCLH